MKAICSLNVTQSLGILVFMVSTYSVHGGIIVHLHAQLLHFHLYSLSCSEMDNTCNMAWIFDE